MLTATDADSEPSRGRPLGAACRVVVECLPPAPRASLLELDLHLDHPDRLVATVDGFVGYIGFAEAHGAGR